MEWKMVQAILLPIYAEYLNVSAFLPCARYPLQFYMGPRVTKPFITPKFQQHVFSTIGRCGWFAGWLYCYSRYRHFVKKLVIEESENRRHCTHDFLLLYRTLKLVQGVLSDVFIGYPSFDINCIVRKFTNCLLHILYLLQKKATGQKKIGMKSKGVCGILST